MAGQIIGTRLKALRQERSLSQDGMARLFGFKDLQTVSAIETGVRRVTAEELLLAVEKLRVAARLFHPIPFGWTARRCSPGGRGASGGSSLASMSGRPAAGSVRTGPLAEQVGQRAPLMRRALGLTKLSRFEDAVDAGERFVAEFELGVVPAQRLAAAMQDQFGILVLMVDAYRGISGAACRLPEFDAVADRTRGSGGAPELRLGA